MTKLNRKDLRKLRALRMQVEKLNACYQGMTNETKMFLTSMFTDPELKMLELDMYFKTAEAEILKK